MNNAEYAAMCQYNTTWSMVTAICLNWGHGRDSLSGVCKCVNHKSKSDGNLITKYPCRYILAPGQAHDADNHSVGSLIH